MRVQCCGDSESAWIDVYAGSQNAKVRRKKEWNIGNKRPTPIGMNPIRKNMIHTVMHMNV